MNRRYVPLELYLGDMEFIGRVLSDAIDPRFGEPDLAIIKRLLKYIERSQNLYRSEEKEQECQN